MYIQPSSTLILLKGCPCDPEYNNTLYFVSAGLQETYFKTLAKYTFSDLSYIRVNRGEIRVEKKVEDLYDCNYLMFQNTAFGDKWFYAFIKSVDYANNSTSSIKFEIDEIQTWYFETNFRDCFIERTHTVTDNPGENLVPEQLEIGEYVFDKLPGVDWSRGPGTENYLVLATFERKSGGEFVDSPGQAVFGYFSGFTITHLTSSVDLLAFIEQATKAHKDAGIYYIFKVPPAIGKLYDTAVDTRIPGYEYLIEYAVPTGYGSPLGDYVPKNNKLYTWPYYGIYVTDNNGRSATFPFEYFKLYSNAARFALDFTAAPIPKGLLVPFDYKGVGGETVTDTGVTLSKYNYNEKFDVTIAATCAWTGDYYQQYLASRGGLAGVIGDIALNTATAAWNSRGTGNIAPAVSSLATSTFHNLIQLYWASLLPDQAKGRPTEDANAVLGRWGFDAYKVHVRAEYAKIIDGYFDQFGYAINKVGTPNRKTRPHWTFIKTKGCTLSGSIPADSVRRICQIHDKGITYWSNPEEVGDYSIDNSPAGELPPTPVDPVEPSTPENFVPRLSEDGILNNPYWYKDNRYYQAGYGMPNCTCYALGRWYEIQGSSTPFNFPGYWDGMDWYQMCVDAGYQTSKTAPMVGACMSWTHDSAGHVAIVEQIKYNDDGTVYSVITSNSAWQGDFWYPQEILASNGWKYRDDQTFNGFGYHPSLVAQLTGGETNGPQEP